MSIETEKRINLSERERNYESRESKEGEVDAELKKASAMEKADYLVKEVKSSKKQMQNIVMHMQQVTQAIRQLRAQLQLVQDDDDPASIKQDKKKVEELKLKIKGYGDELYIGWQNDTTYGVDRVITTASPFASGTYQSLLFDDNRPLQEKQAITLKATHKPLVSGESIQLGYKTNRASSYTTDTANSTVGSTVTRLPIQTSMARFYEYQFEVILATTGSTNPTITSIGLEYDDLTAETLV